MALRSPNLDFERSGGVGGSGVWAFNPSAHVTTRRKMPPLGASACFLRHAGRLPAFCTLMTCSLVYIASCSCLFSITQDCSFLSAWKQCRVGVQWHSKHQFSPHSSEEMAIAASPAIYLAIILIFTKATCTTSQVSKSWLHDSRRFALILGLTHKFSYRSPTSNSTIYMRFAID
jgi:hypothetical protein